MSAPAHIARENGKKGGRPKGKKNKATLEKEAVLLAFKERAMRSADVLFNAQLGLARGQQFLYRIDKKKVIGPKGGVSYQNQKPVLVTAQWEIEAYLENLGDGGDAEDENDREAAYYYLTTKEPNNQAADSLLDRTFGKAVNNVDVTSGGKTIGAILDELEGKG